MWWVELIGGGVAVAVAAGADHPVQGQQGLVDGDGQRPEGHRARLSEPRATHAAAAAAAAARRNRIGILRSVCFAARRAASFNRDRVLRFRQMVTVMTDDGNYQAGDFPKQPMPAGQLQQMNAGGHSATPQVRNQRDGQHCLAHRHVISLVGRWSAGTA